MREELSGATAEDVDSMEAVSKTECFAMGFAVQPLRSHLLLGFFWMLLDWTVLKEVCIISLASHVFCTLFFSCCA